MFMRFLLGLTRIIVGGLFIFSGLIKANDPQGLSYKMQEFFEILGMGFLDDYTLIFSILMIAFEIIAGVAVLLGWQFRLFSWMLFILIVFFTFLTGYAVFSGKIKECGCFGDCIKLTSNQSFIKDIVLFAMIGFLLYKRDQVKSLLKPGIAIFILVLISFFSFWIQFYVLEHLPIFDCLPYKKGVDIREKMQIPSGAIPDSTVINFVYQKDGKEVEFDAEHFPSDFNDSNYVFLRRYDKLIREGNAKPTIKDFVIISPTGADTTDAILSDPRQLYILFTKKVEPDNNNWLNDFKAITESLKKNERPIFAVSSDADNLMNMLKTAGIDIPVYKGDLVAIKTAARSIPTLFEIQQGVILDKWGRGDFKDAKTDILR
jgi:uncharacterized membrane protein YphA (DoxX/SURF4 family)